MAEPPYRPVLWECPCEQGYIHIGSEERCQACRMARPTEPQPDLGSRESDDNAHTDGAS